MPQKKPARTVDIDQLPDDLKKQLEAYTVPDLEDSPDGPVRFVFAADGQRSDGGLARVKNHFGDERPGKIIRRYANNACLVDVGTENPVIVHEPDKGWD